MKRQIKYKNKLIEDGKKYIRSQERLIIKLKEENEGWRQKELNRKRKRQEEEDERRKIRKRVLMVEEERGKMKDKIGKKTE